MEMALPSRSPDSCYAIFDTLWLPGLPLEDQSCLITHSNFQASSLDVRCNFSQLYLLTRALHFLMVTCRTCDITFWENLQTRYVTFQSRFQNIHCQSSLVQCLQQQRLCAFIHKNFQRAELSDLQTQSPGQKR